MDIRERQEGGVTILELDGRFTMNDRAGLLREAVTGVLDRGGRHVVLDLSRVKYIDSTRLGELITSHISAANKGGALSLLRTPARIMELLEMVGLAGVFEHLTSIEEAVAHEQADRSN